MTNTATKTTAIETPYLFLVDSHDSNYETKILVTKKEWFKETPLCQTRTQYGQLAVEHMDGEHNGEDCCITVKAYEYWDGSNFRTVELTSEFDTRYTEITDDEEIEKLHNTVEQAENEEWQNDGTGYKSCEVNGYKIVKSQWQGDFELYSITETED